MVSLLRAGDRAAYLARVLELHADAEQPLKAWHAEAEKALWEGPQDIKARYASASFIGSDRAVFNIAGNKYRLIVAIKYELRIIFIRFIGTHRDTTTSTQRGFDHGNSTDPN